MNASPRALTSRAPSPRSASEIRKRGAPARLSAVGWNCTNSRSATRAPAWIRERDAVAGRDGGVRRLAKHLAGAAGRQQHRRARAPRGARRPRRRTGRRDARPSSTTRSVTSAWLIVVDRRQRARRAPTARGRSRGRWRRRRAARGGRCAPPRGRAPVAVGVAIEARAPLHQLAHVARAFLDQHAHRRLVAQPVAGAHRVAPRAAPELSSAPIAAAMPPCA